MNQQDIALLAKEILAKSTTKIQIPTMVPATVLAYSEGLAVVTIDGDGGAPTPCANITGLGLGENDRVMVSFFPPRGIFVTGIIGEPGWTPYTPAVTGWSLGNGSAVGDYKIAEHSLALRATVIAGSTTTFGAAPVIGLPTGVEIDTPVRSAAGVATLRDDSTGAIYNAFARALSTTTIGFKLTGSQGNDNLTSTVPFTWATSDELNFSLAGIKLSS